MFDSIEKGFTGKTAIVTGATFGIGMACAEAFCFAGCNVVIAARSKEKGEKIAKELSQKWDVKCVYMYCDVADVENIKKVVEDTATEFGRIDVLVNCAGYYPVQKPIDECSIEDYDRILSVNLRGYFAFSKYALPYLRRTKGNIVNIGSVLGVVAKEGSSMYCSTKGAIHSFTIALAIDEARNGVRVNEVRPGHIRNEQFDMTAEKMSKEDASAFLELHKKLQWMGRGGTPEEVAKAVLFMASDWASFTTGSSLNVSGGYEFGEGIKQPLHEWDTMEVK